MTKNKALAHHSPHFHVLSLFFLFHVGCFLVQVLFAWPEDWSKNYEKGERFVSMLRGAVNARKAVMVLKGDKRLPTPLNPVSGRASAAAALRPRKISIQVPGTLT